MKFETLEVAGFDSALYGMRNPLKSYNKADSKWQRTEDGADEEFIVGPNDYKLMKNLWKGGTEHRKWMRQVAVWVDITAPRYWWSEWDTYKIGTSANSESTMHRLTKDGVKKEDLDFPFDNSVASIYMSTLLIGLNNWIDLYNEETDPDEKEKLFLIIKGLLPEAYMQKRTVCLNYEVLANMYRQRKNHRLPQWHKDFVEWIKTLPYSEFITGNFDE